MPDQNEPRNEYDAPYRSGGSAAGGAHPHDPGASPGPAAQHGPGDGAPSVPRYDQPPAPHYPQPASRPEGERSFWGALFDLKFEHFVTIKFAKFLFVLAIVINCLVGFVMVVMGIVSLTESASGILLVLWGLVGTLVNIVVWRVVLEFVISTVRTAQNTTALVHGR